MTTTDIIVIVMNISNNSCSMDLGFDEGDLYDWYNHIIRLAIMVILLSPDR